MNNKVKKIQKTIKEEESMNSDTKYMEYQKIFICFMLYSVIGWMYEVFLEVVVYRWGFTNRGVLFGPYCPVYGVGAIMFLLTFYKYKKRLGIHPVVKVITIFLGCMFIATTIELITSYILEAAFGYWPWQTYTDYAIHFQGRIALSPSIRFGLGGILFLYIIQPLFDRGLGRMKRKHITMVSAGLLMVVLTDVLVKGIIKMI